MWLLIGLGPFWAGIVRPLQPLLERSAILIRKNAVQ